MHRSAVLQALRRCEVRAGRRGWGRGAVAREIIPIHRRAEDVARHLSLHAEGGTGSVCQTVCSGRRKISDRILDRCLRFGRVTITK